MRYYLHKIETDEFGVEHTSVVGKTSKTYERAVIRAKKLENAMIYRFPNKPVSLFRQGLLVIGAQ